MTPTEPPQRLMLGANNVYVLREGSDCLLVDAGPDYEGAWNSLITQLAQLDIAAGDIRQVVLTHNHRDHAGLAARWQAHGARIICSREDAPGLQQGADTRRVLRERGAALLAAHGVPSEMAWWSLPTRESTGDHGAADGHGAWPGPLRMTPVRPDVLVDDGTCIALGQRRLILRVCPGHSPGSILLCDGDAGTVYTGDHLLPQQVATVGIQFDGDERWPSMPPFVRSLEQTRTLRGTRALPGHGEPMPDTAEAAAWSLRYIERRSARVLRRLRAGPATAYEIVVALFPHHRPEHLAPLMTEVIGLLDLLGEQGAVAVVEHQGRLRFSAT